MSMGNSEDRYLTRLDAVVEDVRKATRLGTPNPGRELGILIGVRQ